MENELKPCPFCGGKAWVNKFTAYGAPKATVCCYDCNCTTDDFDTDDFGEAEEKAIKHWNTRT